MSQHTSAKFQRNTEQNNYLGAIIDQDGREIPISDAMIENSLQALQGTSAEFICRLAQRAAN
ncbi:PA1571 family protein [Zhongshania guokunii]|uniref:PA1571 family protein n=1 Tax=Zhongshania guokunii TaxID=641783 RepID=A0ABV3UBV3_9GAMM